jgi:hypothetical protein
MACNTVRGLKDVAGRCAAALALVVLLRLEVWLLFAAGIGIATYIIRRSWLYAHRWRPLQVAAAALALAHPPENRPRGALVGVLAGATPRRVVVDRASRILHDRESDPEWGAAMQEIVLADELTTVLATDHERDWLPVRLMGWALVTVAGAVLQLPVGMFIAGFVGTLIAVIDIQEQRQVRPMLLATKAANPPAAPPVAGPPPISRLALIAQSKTIIDRAIARIDQAAISETERGSAKRLLNDARQLLPAGRPHTGVVITHVPELAIIGFALALKL